MSRLKWFITIASVLIVSACGLQNSDIVSQHRSAASDIQALLDHAVTAGVPGISAAVATRQGIVWTGVAGSSDLQTGTPVRPDMLFGIGSITKTFVAAVILQLADQGRLDLNLTAASLLGTSVQGIPNADKATIAHLLNHTGGVPSWEDDPAWIRDARGDRLDVNRIWAKPATLSYITGHAPLAAPGETFSYANTNFTLLGMIIEKVTGEDVVQQIHRRILTPIGLTDIYLEGFEPVAQSRLAHRYHWATPDFRSNAGINAAFRQVRSDLIDASGSNLSVEWTAGGMVATARDLALYGVALRDGRLLSAKSMTFLTEWFPAGEAGQVGHNLFRRQYPDGAAIIGHTGDVLGFTASLYWTDGTDVVMAVVSNVGSMHSGEVPATAKSVGRNREFIAAATKLAASK